MNPFTFSMVMRDPEICKGRLAVNKLNERLLRDNRIEDLKKATTDLGYQQQLLKEYQLITE